MIALPLRLRFHPDPLPVAAGWIADADVSAWLSEARRVMTADAKAEVRFYPLAISPRDPAVGGALLIVSGSGAALDRVFGPRVQRMGFVLPGVLAPVQSRLEPALTPEECRRLFPWTLHFFHPVLGLTGFDAADALTPERLLLLPPVERMGWFAAVPGPPAPPPLQQITLVQEVSLEELMAGEAGDIATQRPDKIRKPGAPGADLLDRAAGAAGSAIGSLGAGVLRALGAGGAADRVAKWSQRLWEEVHDRRKKELNKLLDRFDKDLLDALRHAIPLTGAESRRGAAAQPGWQLGARSMELNSRSHGSGPVDVWNIDHETRLKLERRYREAATREAGAGHYGRAAYIYGELLGDWNMAAQMLEKAGRPREAARIYLDRLRSGPRAAECLEKAGLLAEAAALYQEAGMHEKAGDLLAALGRQEAAREQWMLAVKGLTNPLDQARLLETKLGEVDRALFVLDRAWPAGSHALACFQEEFALLGRHGRHEEAAAVLDRLERNPKARPSPVFSAVTGLGSVFDDYPDSAIAARAGYLALQFSGEFLAREPAGDSARKLLALIPHFAPGDRVMARDAQRFSISRNPPPVPLLSRGGKTLRPDRVVELERKNVVWQSLACGNRGLSAAGWQDSAKAGHGKVVCTRFMTESGILGMSGEIPRASHGQVRHLECGSQESLTAFHVCSRGWFGWLAPKLDFGAEEGIAVGRAANENEFLLLHYTPTASLCVTTMSRDLAEWGTRVLDLAPPAVKDADWFVGGHGDDIWVAGPGVVCCVDEKVEFQIAQLNGPVTGFAVAPPVLPSQAIAVALGEAVLLIPHGKGKPLECVNLYAGDDLTAPPVVTFTRDGRAVIAEARGGVVYTLRKSCEKSSDIVIPPGSGMLISAAAYGSNGFAFLTSTGKVLLFGG